jgi:aspartyl/asparaginyl-tRNA synthetase
MAAFSHATHDFFRERGFLPALLPITCGAVSSPIGLGSDSLPVEIDLFGARTFLADSMQFHLEYVLRQHPQGVFYLMSTFRGEDPDARHLNEFFHAEAELVGGLEDVMTLVESYVVWLTRRILRDLSPALEGDIGGVDHLHALLAREQRFPRIKFQDAKRLLGKNPTYYTERAPGILSISREGEQRLMSEHHGFVWLTHMPHLAVPFYQALDADGEHALCADLLFGIGEVVGCGERHSNASAVDAALSRHGVSAKDYAWYLRLKEEYPLRTAGFGLGMERYLLWVLKHDDIRDIHLITRLKGQLSSP